MQAVTYQGVRNVQVKDVPDAALKNNDDVLVQITSTAICGSDLHLIHGLIDPNLEENYVIGHEPMGIVVETGPDVTKVKKGDRVIIPFNVSCGECYYCKHHLESECDNSNQKGEQAGVFGFSKTFGGYPGGQAELLRVPYGNFTPFVIPKDCELEDEKLLFLADAIPTAYWGVENAGVKKGDTVIVLGCGPIGLLTQKFTWMKGAARVIAVDHIQYRLEHAKKNNNVEIFNFTEVENLGAHLKEITGGGADVVIDCVGIAAKQSLLESLETVLQIQGGSLSAVVLATQAVRKGGTISLVGVYGSNFNAFPLGDLYKHNITLKMGLAPVVHYIPELYEKIANGSFDPTDIITHRLPLSEAEHGYQVFDGKMENCIKVVLKPQLLH